MRTPEEYFRLGAEAMRTEIAVRLTMSRKPGEMLLAPTILQIPLPKFQEPELITISKEKS